MSLMGAHGEREGQSGGAGSPCSVRGDGLGCAGKAAGTPVLSAESPSGTPTSQGSRRPPDDPTHPPGDPTRLRDAPSRAAPSSRRAGPHGCRTKPAGRRLRGPCISVSSAEHTLLPGACTPRSPEPTPGRRGPPNPANLSVRTHVLCPSPSRRHLSRSNPPHTSLVSLVWWPQSGRPAQAGLPPPGRSHSFPKDSRGPGAWLGRRSICGRKARRETFKQRHRTGFGGPSTL